MRIAPRGALILATAILLSVLAVSMDTAYEQPWLGVELAEAEKGLLIKGVNVDGPSAGILRAGDIVLEIADEQSNSIALKAEDLVQDPDTFPTFKERNHFFERQSTIYRILQQQIVAVSLNDGRVVRVQPHVQRPVSSFPLSFWLMFSYGTVALLVATLVWAGKQDSVPAKYLLLSGMGSVMAVNGIEAMAVRELALDGSMYPWMIFIYHMGNNCFTFGLAGVVWHYPRTLGHLPVLKFMALYMSFFIVNENFELIELPGNSVLFQVPLYFILHITLVVAQWKKSHGRPLDRAVVKMFVVAWCAIALFSGGYYLSELPFGVPKISLSESFFFLLIFHLMFAVLVARYRLFNLERWWLGAWVWLIAGVAVIFIDLVLFYLLQLNFNIATGVSLAIAGWLYFPARQWIMGRFLGHHSNDMHQYLGEMVERLFAAKEHADIVRYWGEALQRAFRPLNITALDTKMEKVEIAEDGMAMVVPHIIDKGSFRLGYANRGERLFAQEDVTLAQSMWSLASRALKQHELSKREVRKERERIMRDLHDDVGSRLLQLSHRADQSDQAELARGALKALREVIYCIDDNSQVRLGEQLVEWRDELRVSLDSAGHLLLWKQPPDIPSVYLSSRKRINIGRILQETISNVVRHAHANQVEVSISFQTQQLCFLIADNGTATSDKAWIRGRGIHNIQNRAMELGGKANWYVPRSENQCGCAVEICVPIDEREL